MPLPPYTQYFSPKSLQRAEEYIHSVKIKEISDKTIKARVLGSYKYKVKIKWNENEEYTVLKCSCPYDYDGYCKHIGAVLMYLEENSEILKGAESSFDQQYEEIEFELPIEIKQLNKSQLITLLYKLMKQAPKANELIDKEIKDIMSKKSQKKVDYASLVSNYIDKNSGDFGYLDWDSTGDVDSYFSSKMHKLAKSNDHKGLIDLALEVIPAINDQLRHVDDSYGFLGTTIYTAFDHLKEVKIHVETNNELRNYMISKLMNLLDNKNIYDWDAGTFTWEILSEIIEDMDDYNLLVEKMNEEIKKSVGFNSDYCSEKSIEFRLNILKKKGLIKEYDELLHNNLKFHDIRKILIERLILNEEYDNAIEQIKEGLVISTQKSDYGDIQELNDLLLDVYIKANKRNDIIQMSRSLTLQSNSKLKYYKIFKSQIEVSNWGKEYFKLVKEIKSNGSDDYFKKGLADIYTEEKEWSDLIAEVSKTTSLHQITDYLKYLRNDFSFELTEIFKKAIFSYATQTGRNIYEEILEYLQEMSKLKNGNVEAIKLRDILLDKYKNRSAMKEILNRLN